ncbi:MAG: UMP kinase, partial [Candidatus Eisenbacteria bacterium]|nr:UMP kinase [Candidatus Eisenbacteria bacterium]
FSAFAVPRLALRHTPRDARAALAAGEVVLLAGGTGNPYFTTDTAAAVRALELECTLLIKGTKVDGVYDADPVTQPGARRFAHLTYDELLRRRLGVMDLTAVTLCMENALPVVVLDATKTGSVERYLREGAGGTRIEPAERRAPGR